MKGQLPSARSASWGWEMEKTGYIHVLNLEILELSH